MHDDTFEILSAAAGDWLLFSADANAAWLQTSAQQHADYCGSWIQQLATVAQCSGCTEEDLDLHCTGKAKTIDTFSSKMKIDTA